MQYDGLIFDLDGTLWDACEAVARSWTCTLRDVYGVTDPPSIDEIQSIMGLQSHEIAQRLFARYGSNPDEMAARCMCEECAHLEAHGAHLYPDVIITLRQLAEVYPLSIVSNCQKGYIESFLHFYHLEPLFADFVCEGGTGMPKADNIRLVMARNGMHHPAYIGDTQGDFEAAARAGAAFIWAAYGFGQALQAPLRINCFRELLTLVRK